MLRIFRHYVAIPAIALLFFEFLILTLIFYYVSIYANTGPTLAELPFVLALSASMGVVVIATMFSVGIYDKWHLADYPRIAKRLLLGFFLVYPLFLLFALFKFDLVSTSFAADPSFYVATMATAFAGIIATRVVYVKISNIAELQRNILVVGVGMRAAKIETFAASRREHHFKIVGFIKAPNELSEVSPSQVVSGEESLLETAQRLGANEIVVAMSDRRGFPVQPLLECRFNGLIVTDYLTFWERESSKLMLDALDPSWLIFSDGFKIGAAINAGFKRFLDLFVSTLLLVLLLPLLAVVSVAIRLEGRGPILYRQERVGRNGKTFTLYKFRSMRVDAEAAGAPQWAAVRDNRITKIGALLRNMRIDEIPQVLNVLKGDMSFIGPRPERPFFVENLAREIPYYNERHRLRPGITGWAQINYPYGASIEDAREKLAYDLYYIKNYSLMLDLLTLLETVHVVFWPQGVR